ncbi:hypothetical protein PENTCL1PPCAC_29657 [Pristionchus entomophagus]|uniref:UBR-type domain-containing protein n=1 Tax=Pristionchus entomophagus TaxID=358040 RepID=A0AAV5UMC7_9BILA|nr:hypothetical protein PENTCL1PPCAC_29657 [Pristionchus entomophagus]
MSDRFELLSFADTIISTTDLDKNTALDFVDELHHNIGKLSIGDKECVSSACKKVIEWLIGQDEKELEKEEWFSIVRKLCTVWKGCVGDQHAGLDSYADILKDIHRDNMKLLVKSNVLLRLIEMCFSKSDPLLEDNKTNIDFKDFMGRFSLLSSLLDCRWEGLSADQVNDLRYSASTILKMIPAISASAPTEKILIRFILRAVNKIVDLVAGYEGFEEFAESILVIYRDVIAKTTDWRDQEHVLTSLITNLNGLNGILNSQETMELLWEMLMKMCKRLREEGGETKTDVSPQDDSPKTLDEYTRILVEGTIQETFEDAMKEKVYPREEVCNGIIAKLEGSAYTIQPTVADFESVVRTCMQASPHHSPALCSTLSRLYTKLMKGNAYTLDEQNKLVDVVFELWNHTNDTSALILLKRIFEGDASRSLLLATAYKMIEQDGSSNDKKFYAVLEDCVRYTKTSVTKELARRIIEKITDMNMKESKSEERLLERLRYLNIILGIKLVDEGVAAVRRGEANAMALFEFNELLNSKEYTRMLGASMKKYFGIDKRRKDSTFMPPVNEEYVRRIVNGEKLLSYHHVHYFLIHASVSKSKPYLDYLIAMNGGPNIEPLLTELSSPTVMDRMIQSMLGILQSSKEMFPLQLSSRFNFSIEYIVQNLKDGTIPSLSPPTLNLLTKAITNVELRYVLSEFSNIPADRETARPRMEKLIQIAKCSLLTQEERNRLMDGVKTEVNKAIGSIMNGYTDPITPNLIDALLIQQKLITILKCHSDKNDLDASTIKYMDLYIRLTNPTHSIECLLDLLMGALCESPTLRFSMESGASHMGKAPLSPYITSPLMDRFTRLLLSLFSLTESKFLPSTIEWGHISKKVISKWLDAVGQTSEGVALPTSLPLIVFLSKIVQGENLREETRSMVMGYINKKGPTFVIRALRASPCKPVFFHSLTPIILNLRSRASLSSEVDAMLIECVPLLFAHPVTEMIEFFPVLMQSTDRYAQTQLHWKSLVFPVMDEEGIEDVIDPIQASFKLLAQLSSFKGLIFAMLDTLGACLQTWLMNMDHDIMVLRGVTVTPNTEVIWKVQLISQALGYISCVAEEVRKREGEGDNEEEESDEEEQDEKLLLVERREEEAVTKCTFVNTSKEFTKQHWYNCYTCGMTDSEGVCTVCALNCHRGHDISYSKLGSFFCDCGAKKCGALKGAKNKPPAKRMKRMKKAKRAEKWTPHVSVPDDVTKEEVKEFLHVTQEVLTHYYKSLNDLILGIEVAYEGKFNIESRREGAMRSMEHPSFKYDECIMVGKIVENEGLEQLDRKTESIDRNTIKECSEIVRLRDGSTLFLHVNEHSSFLSLVYMGVTSGGEELGDTRVERESLPFAPKRIAVMNDHIAITGVDEMAFLRVSLDSGDIIQKEVIRMKEASASNPILKAVWYMEGYEKESVVLAVATLQFVRIYNVFKDLENHELELVLPVGNVVDLTFIKKKDEDYIWITILSSPSHLYYHQLGGPGPSVLDDSRSIYLTNTLPLPVQTAVVSLHFSQVTRMLYISFQNELFCAHIKNGEVMELVEDSFYKLDVGGGNVESFVGWAESDGMVAAIAHPATSNKVIFIYPTLNEVLIQVAHLLQPAQSISLAPSSSFESLMGLAILSGHRKPAMLFTSNWASQPDLWMEHRPMKMDKIAMVEEEEGEECSHDQLVTLFESCNEVREVEYTCRELDEFYASDKLTERLKTPEKKAVVSVNQDELNITIRVSKRHYEVKGLRLEVEGSNGPRSLSYNGKDIDLIRRMRSIYDIPLSPNDTIKSERPLTLRLGCKDAGTTTIVSLRAYGDSREDSYARCLAFPALSLPYQCVLHSLKLLNELWEYDLLVPTHVKSEKGEMREWIAESCLLVIPPRACRPTVTAAGKQLLRRYWRGEQAKYHAATDKVVIASFAQFGRMSQHLPLPVLRSYLSAMRRMMKLRYDNMVKYAHQFFGDVVTMGSLLHREMECVEGDDSTLNLLISVYLQFACSLLSNGHPLSDQVMVQMIGVVTNHKKLRMWRLTEELRKIVRDSLDGVGVKSGDWIEQLIGVITQKILNEIRMPLPVWWKEGVKMEEEKIDLPFQRAIKSMNALVEVGASVMKELEAENIVKILADMVDRIDTHSVMREEDDVRVKNVRIGGVIALIVEVCRKRGKNEREESVETIERCIDDEDELEDDDGGIRRDKEAEEKSRMKEETDEGILEVFNQIVNPLLQDQPRRIKLLSLDFRLLEEALKFLSGLKEGQKMESGWRIQEGIAGLSTSDCLLEYYLRVARCTLELPTLFLHPKSPMSGLSADRKRIICELIMVDDKIPVKAKAQTLLLKASFNDGKKYADTLSEYAITRNLDILRFEYLPKFAYTHEDSTAMIEIISRVRETAMDKNDCWRRICERNLRWILVLTSKVSEPVGVAMLELIQTALRITKDEDMKECRSSQPPPSPADFSIADTLFECAQSTNVLKVLIMKYLLGKEESRRWLMHSVCRSLMQLARRKNQIELASLLFYQVVPMGRRLGERGAQLTDLCSAYLPTLLPASTLHAMAVEELTNLDAMITKLDASEQKGSADWMVKEGMGWREALYLSPDPCIQCLRPNEMMETLKLSAIKGEAKYTTNALMFKLNGHYEINKVVIKLADIKKTRMFGRVSVFYVEKAIESAVELKSNRDTWKMMATTQVSSWDNEVTLSVSIPIVTNGLVIELSEVNETRGNSQVHCPRCSSLVRPNPGVCDNCGENVYQCVKCRAINYDEKEPFLCSACGYCKYARMEMSVVGRLQPTMVITADNDKPMASRASKSMNKLQWEMDTNRAQLCINAVLAQSLTIRHPAIPTVSYPVDGRVTMDPLYPQLAQIGPNDSRSMALSECMRKIRAASDALVSQSLQLVSIREAMRKMEQVYSPALHSTTHAGFYNASDDGCIGCLTSSIVHSISLLRSLSVHPTISATILSHSDLIYKRMVTVSSSIDILRDECESLMICLCQREEGVQRLCGVVMEGRISPSALARSLMTMKSVGWSERMDTLVQCAMAREDDDEAQIGVIQVLMDSMKEAKVVLKMMEERKKMKIFMDERGPSGSDQQMEEKEDGAWIIIDAIINSQKELSVDDIEKERRKGKEMENFLWRLIFSRSIFVRSHIAHLIRSMMSVPGQAGAVVSICLQALSHARLNEDSRCDQFFLTFNCLIKRGQINLRLFQSNFHLHLMGVILSESTRLGAWERGEHSVSHSSGIFIYHCTNLLTNLLSGTWLESLLLSSSRLSLLVPLLHSCILLRRVTIKRNRPIARALNQLEGLLRRCTAEEGLNLLTAAVACLSQVKDEKSRADIVGVILETLDPRENESDEFLIQVEKDAAQEDFLQGRMQHNPYKSGDASMGPLMRDIKNKICRESELIAFLDDDNGMELLVNGKIISLSLAVSAVYDAVWRPFHPGEHMVIIYRMRGLMGDAVEPFVETIDDKSEGECLGEEEARLLMAFLSCGGVSTTLRLLSDCSLSPNGCLLLVQLRKLLLHLLRVEKMKKEVISSGGVSILLGVVKRVRTLGVTDDQSMAAAQTDLLKMVTTLVTDPIHHPILGGISGAECEWLMALLEEEGGPEKRDRPHSQLVLQVTKILGNAVLGSDESEEILVKRLKDGLNWEDLLNEKIDSHDHASRLGRKRRLNWMDDVERRADSFTLIVDAILPTEKGTALKHKLIKAGVIEHAVKALVYMHPPLYGTVESPEWKTYLARPALKLILGLLKGMAKGDEQSQVEIAKKALPMLHRLEQVSSAEHLGTLAENVMEALSQNKEVAAQIDKVRDETKQKKRQMAMAMREKQLSKLGMQMGRKGEVKVSSRAIVNEPDLGEASDPLTSCCICRESILTGTRVPATYAYAIPYRAQDLPTHCSLSLSVMVHVDCHFNAIRRSNGGRNAEEWTKAALHNSGARCNMIVPIRVSDPTQSDWDNAILRMESDLEAVVPGGGPVTRYRVFLDMCNLIRKFVLNRSFSESAGGGGRESNMQYLGILHLLALNLPEGDLACTMASERLNSFLLTELTVIHWNEERMDVLRAFLRDIEIGEAKGVARDSLLRESLLQWTFIDLYFNRVIPMDGEDRVGWLRSHFGETLKKTGELVKYFDTTLLPVKKNEDLAVIIGVDMNDALSLSTVTTPT